LGAKRKRRNEEIDSEEDEEPTPKRPKSGGTKPSGSQPTVEIPGTSQAARQPINEMVGLLRELVEEVRELKKITRGAAGLGVQIYQQSAQLVRLGERQSFLSGELLKRGSGSGSGKSESEGVKKDKGKGKMTEGNDETMRDDGVSGSEEEDEARLGEDVGGSVAGSGSDTEK
jgi:hypothetical protein